MLFSDELYVGIDLTKGEKTIFYAALDKKLEPVTLSQGNYKTLLSYLGGQQKAVIGLYGPTQPNQKILTDAERRNQYLIEMSKGRPGNMRVAEYQLKQHHLPTYKTPSDEESAPRWMQTSFNLYKYLHNLKYQKYHPGLKADLQVVEVLPEVGFKAWVEGDLLPKKSFYGKMQRQLVLYELGIELSDPMHYFEEITRYKILQGILPANAILSDGMISALSSAYLAWQTQHQPEAITLVGLEQEGQIAIPTSLIADT